MTDTAATAQMPGFQFSDPAIAQPDAHADAARWRDPAEPRQLKFWSAYRSGPALSVSGMDAETGATRTIAGIKNLGPDAQGKLFITDGDDQRWELVL